MKNTAIYELLLDKVDKGRVADVMIGRTWTYCSTKGSSQQHIGVAMSPEIADRTLPWSGTLRGKSLYGIANWITSWNPFEASVAMAAINASINADLELQKRSELIQHASNANLSVFEYFLPRLTNKKVVVVGRYPGLDQYQDILDMTVLERSPGKNDLPDVASEYVIADADWVFLTATTIINKTFPRLAELAKDTNLVLMGPTVPWLPELTDFGVDFLAGVEIKNPELLKQVIAEGGGVRIFNEAIQYRIMDLGAQEMQWHETAISDLVSRRESLKMEMEDWYRKQRSSFPRKRELLTIDRELSSLDSQYKRLWDARHEVGFSA